MQEIQCARELSDQELENVVGGVRHFTPGGAIASAGASASAVGGFFHISGSFATTEAFTVVSNTGANVSFALGVAFAFAV